MFSQVSVCQQGVSVSVQGGLHPRGPLSRRVSVQEGSLSRRSLCPGGLCPWGGSLSGGLCPGGSVTKTPPRTVMSGRYTSYWNAFLFLEGILDIAGNKICCILCKKIQFFSISDLILDLCEQHKQKIQFNLCLIISW